MNESLRPALQLYSVRELEESLPETIARVGETSFEGVEFANRFREADPAATAAALEENDVEPVAAHADLPAIEAAIEGETDLLNRLETVGCERIITPHVGAHHFLNRQTVRTLSYRLTNVASRLETHGIELGYHTSRVDCYPFLPVIGEALFDLGPIGKGMAYRARWAFSRIRRDEVDLPSDTGLWNLFSRTLPEDLFFELESAEITAAGLDPAAVLSLFEDRVPLLHIRDVAPTGRFGAYENVKSGEGAVDFESLVEIASTESVEWLVYEDETNYPPSTKITEGAAFLERLLDVGHSSNRQRAVSGDD